MELLPEHYWAKLRLPEWHPLLMHLADVGAVAEALLRAPSVLADRLANALNADGALSEEVRGIVVYMALLHDIGKLHHGFQRRRENAVPPSEWGGHVRPLLNSRGKVRELRRRLEEIERRSGGREAFDSAICHHGTPYIEDTTKPSAPAQACWHASAGRDPLAELARIELYARRWSGVAESPSVAWTPAALHLLAGIITLADWIGSSEEVFRYRSDSYVDPDGYWEGARNRAAEACRGIGTLVSPIRVSEGSQLLEDLFPKTFPAHTPTILQHMLASMQLPAPGTRLLIESDTGSGKTEAALTLYARLRAEGQVAGLFFALPTRATASAMHKRVVEACQLLYPGSEPIVALAVGGQRNTPERAALAGADPDVRETGPLAHWTSKSHRHAMAGEIVVGTVDQALLACLPARHAHIRLAGLSRLMLVVDEVHSFDRYMSKLLQSLTEMLTTLFGSTVLFMSATLSHGVRAQLGRPALSWEPDDEADVTRETASGRPYPSLSSKSRGDQSWCEVGLSADTERRRQFHWEMVGEAEGLQAAVAAANQGARVLIVRNTVQDVRATVDALNVEGAGHLIWRPQRHGAPVPYHSRYTVLDRLTLDREVLSDFGPGSTATGVILVATSVVGQSIDVDFDLLITDLCPVDLLIQRLGRVHRHSRSQRHGQGVPKALVIEPEIPLDVLVGRPNSRLGAMGRSLPIWRIWNSVVVW